MFRWNHLHPMRDRLLVTNLRPMLSRILCQRSRYLFVMHKRWLSMYSMLYFNLMHSMHLRVCGYNLRFLCDWVCRLDLLHL
jgi:hypothetical protein